MESYLVQRFHAGYSMLSQTRPLLFAVYLIAIALILALILGLSSRSVWRHVDPVGYSVWRIEHADAFIAPHRNDTGALDAPLPEWRTVVLSADAARSLQTLAGSANPVSRLYALAGLELHDTIAANNMKRLLHDDTSRVSVQRVCQNGRTTQRINDVADIIGSRTFAQSLLTDDGACTLQRAPSPLRASRSSRISASPLLQPSDDSVMPQDAVVRLLHPVTLIREVQQLARDSTTL